MVLPGLLQPWGVAALVLVWTVALLIAVRWYRAKPGRPAVHLDVLAVGLLALLTGGFFWRPLTESGVWMPAGGGDLASFYYPTYVHVARQIKSGLIPLWNPHVFSGMPLAADIQAGLFYPVNWLLYLLVPVDYGSLEWLLIAHYWLASVFTYVLLRDLGLGRLGSIAGGVVFGFCGFMTAHLGHMPMVLVAAWIPLMLVCLRRALLNRTLWGWLWAIIAGVVTAMALLAGHVQIFAYGLMAAGLLWLYTAVSAVAAPVASDAGRGEQAVRTGVGGVVMVVTRMAVMGALVVLIALALGAVQLLPTMQLSAQSVRADISYEEASAFAAQPVTMLNLFLPRVFGSNPTNYSFGPWQTTENWGYSGVVTLALAVAGVALRRERMVGYFVLLLALALVIMVGDLAIVSAWIYKFVPGFSTLRSSGRALVLLGLALAALAAYGLDGLLAALGRADRPRRTVLWWLVGLGSVLAVLALGVLPALYVQALTVPGAEYGKLPGAINDAGMMLIWLAMLGGVIWAAYSGRLAPHPQHAGFDAERIQGRLVPVGGLVLAVLVLDIFSVNSRFNPTTTNILAGYQHYDAISLLYKSSPDQRTGIPLRVNSDTEVQDVWQPSTALLTGLFYDTGGAFTPLKLERYDHLWDVARRSPETPLYDLTGAAFEIASPVITRERSAKWDLIERFEGFDVYRNNNALPRAFLVHEALIEPDPQKIVESLRNFGVEPRHTVVLESGTPVPSRQIGTAEAYAKQLPTAEWVRATRYTPHEVVLTVKADAPGWVVLTDAWYPGWEATVDDRPVAVERAFSAYRAVRVDAGQHTITMRFRPWTWQVGRAVSLLTLMGVLAALVVLLLRARTSAKGGA
jgi:hypothetical protein